MTPYDYVLIWVAAVVSMFAFWIWLNEEAERRRHR